MDSAIEVVKEIKAKIVAATEEGVDENKIQEEIEQLKEQLRTVASAASFSGENWLSVDSGLAEYNPTKTIVASFSRSAPTSTPPNQRVARVVRRAERICAS